MRIYRDLAVDWYALLDPREDYLAEAQEYVATIRRELGPGRHRLLELGAGVGNNAHWLQEDFELTLTDLSPDMLLLAARNCPDARTVEGDMRSLRLDQRFDVVFVHDAIAYMITEADLAAVFATATAHLRPGGLLLVAADQTEEDFQPNTEEDGNDGDGRALRYMEWSWRDATQPGCIVTDFVLAMREGTELPRVVVDRHVTGLFSGAVWLRLLAEAGYVATLERRGGGWPAFVARLSC